MTITLYAASAQQGARFVCFADVTTDGGTYAGFRVYRDETTGRPYAVAPCYRALLNRQGETYCRDRYRFGSLGALLAIKQAIISAVGA